jgi:hypothetical protein
MSWKTTHLEDNEEIEELAMEQVMAYSKKKGDTHF